MSITLNLNNDQASKIIDKYQNYSLSHTNNYTLFRAKFKGSTLTLYKTLTLLIQGNNTNNLYNDICDLIGINDKKEEKELEHSINLSVIGTDEVGTGDFFGPIIVAGVYIDKSQILEVITLGVKDSKTISDPKIIELAGKLKPLVKYHITSLDNMKYNYLVKMHNLNMNKIKALLHNDVLLKLTNKVSNYDSIVIDAFTTKDKYLDYISDQKFKISDVELVEKGESKHLAVACASILARSAFLKKMDALSQEIGFELPKGAGSKVDLAIAKIIKDNSEVMLNKVGKTNFKNLEKVKKDIFQN